MGVPSFTGLPATESDQADCMPCHPLGHMLLWTALLFLAPAAGTPGLPKAVVNLQSKWVNVLQEDDVMLMCQGTNNPGDDFTQWFHNGSSIPTQVQPSYSFKASSNDSGDYKCQTGQTSLSDPVHLDVISANLNDAEEAAKAEAENTVTYSLLLHPEVAEEETEPDYENHL
nr:low affinity immunoglobulin gamma Fc region receptor II-like isoform X1 [Vicugna pacos]